MKRLPNSAFWKPGLSRRERLQLLACNGVGFAGGILQVTALYHLTQHGERIYVLLQGAGLLVMLAGLIGQGVILYARARAEYLKGRSP